MGACGSRSEQKTNHPPSDMITIGGQKEEGYAQLDNDGYVSSSIHYEFGSFILVFHYNYSMNSILLYYM